VLTGQAARGAFSVLAALYVAITLVASAFALPARAHDFWIEPSTFHPRPGGIVALGLRVGQNYVGDPVPRQSSAIDRFFIRQVGPDGKGSQDQSIEGSNNIDPAGFLRADGRATAVIGYSSNGSYIELPADKFEDYLRLYGLNAIIAERDKRGERAKPGRERFYRYAKALLTGARDSALPAQPLGFAYEIVPDADPTVPAGPLRGRVLYDGRPLAGALVEALWRDDPRVKLAARSDPQGGFSFALPRAGVWMIKSVHMVRAGFFAPSDWDSLWASLTFNAPIAMAKTVSDAGTQP
jgi:uncharacterized GH25 family protein